VLLAAARSSSDKCIGKLRSNFLGTEFVLYDDGYNPSKLPKGCVDGKDKDGKGVRRELATCINTQNVIGAPSPRKVRALIPQIVDGKPMVRAVRACRGSGADGAGRTETCAENALRARRAGARALTAPLPARAAAVAQVYCPKTDDQTMLARDKDCRLGTDFVTMASKGPKFNAVTGKYSLNFNGRVKLASVKNVQLVLAGEEEVVMQFGKTGKHDFILDFQYPLTPMQAFAFGLTSLAYKLANEGG
jgi:tubby-related protein 1